LFKSPAINNGWAFDLTGEDYSASQTLQFNLKNNLKKGQKKGKEKMTKIETSKRIEQELT